MPSPLILSTLTSTPLITLVLACVSLCALYGALYRLCFSPIAKFPGPRLAALTFGNESWYDVVCGGRYTWKIREYHERYGPIVRRNPYEIHINDPDFYDEVYVGAHKGKSNKWYRSMRMFGQYDHSSFDALDHDKHRMRREPWNPFFSRSAVARLQPLLIQNCVDKLWDRLAEHRAAGKTVVMTHAYACLTADVISEYGFRAGYGLLDGPELLSGQYDASQRLQRIFPDRCLQYKEWTIPPGTPISMTIVHLHDDPTIFSDPCEFDPDRWLRLETNGRRLQKYLVAFGKG